MRIALAPLHPPGFGKNIVASAVINQERSRAMDCLKHGILVSNFASLGQTPRRPTE